MTRTHRSLTDDRVNVVFLRALGCLAMASHELQTLRSQAQPVAEFEQWSTFADGLLESSRSIMAGACGSQFAGNTIAVLRQGVSVPVGPDHVDRLTERLRRHTTTGRLLGVEGADDLVLSA